MLTKEALKKVSQKANDVPPYSLEAEKAVLGAILNNSSVFINVAGILQSDFFYIEDHRIIYEVIADLDKNNRPADAISVAQSARYRGKITAAYLSELIQSSPITLNIEHYAEIVKLYYFRRRVINACREIINKCLQSERYDEEWLEEVRTDLLNATQEHEVRGLVSVEQVLDETMKEIENRISRGDQLTGVPSGFRDLDALTGGWQQSDLIIMAARPGMGKTALALNWVLAAVKHGFPAAIFSLEMSRTQLMARMVSAVARINSAKIRKGNLTDDEQDKFMKGVRDINAMEANFGIDDTPAISMSELRTRCRRFKQSNGLGLVVIDYLQLIGRNKGARYENREREISEISRGLKALAKELQVPIVALAQLNP